MPAILAQDFVAALHSPEFDGPEAEAWIVGEARPPFLVTKMLVFWAVIGSAVIFKGKHMKLKIFQNTAGIVPAAF
jgi:hypothetical protein